MADHKIFAGPRVRKVRNGLGLTQTAMAEALGISPSYLNLIERNQRPLTVQLLLKLASVYKVDLEELQGDAGSGLVPLREVFADPLLAGEIPGDQELIEFAEAAPNAASGVVKLYRAYREQAKRLSDLAELLAREGHETALAARGCRWMKCATCWSAATCIFPHRGGSGSFSCGARPRRWAGSGAENLAAHPARHRRAGAARACHAASRTPLRPPFHAVVLPERLSPFDQLREMAMEACLLVMGEEIRAELETLALTSNEARRIARFELARYAAHALIMPYGAFLAAAQRRVMTWMCCAPGSGCHSSRRRRGWSHCRGRALRASAFS